jgi:16S rRNA (cytosine967-C5)-methyltransferase
MKIPFRQHHLFQILHLFDSQKGPLDLLLSHYFRAHKAVGAKDRQQICETLYGMIRWRGLLDHLCSPPPSWEKRAQLYMSGFNPTDYLKRQEIPPHVRVSFPKALFQLLAHHYGEEKALEICLVQNGTAPTTVRVNALKITREELLKKWEGLFALSITAKSSLGITFAKKHNFFALEEFKAGFFEIQDEGSQLIAALVQARPKEQVLDYCAGSGGKTLAFAPDMKESGQIYLHDIRPQALEEARKRLRRAGIQNAQPLFPDSSKKSQLLQKMDWVLVDAPCTGLGTLRRNPDMKWKFEPQNLEELIPKQRAIFEEALAFLRPGGKIVYATCSSLPEENENQVDFFMRQFGLELDSTPFFSLPQRGGMDGFFGAVLKKQSV